MATSRPATLIRWVADDNSPNLAQPPAPLVASGYAPGEPLIAQHHNAILHNLTGWVGYLSSAQVTASQVAASNQGMRLLGGGQLTYSSANTTLTWSAPFTIAIPSAADADNQLAAGSVSIPAGSVAYVQANIPVSTQADYASGATTLQNVASTAGLAVGMLASGPGIANGTTLKDVEDGQLTLNQATTQAGSQATVSFASFGPLTVQVADSQSLVPAPNTVILARGTGPAVSVGIGQTELWLRDQEARTLVSQGYGATMTAPAGQALTANQAVYLSAGTSDARTQGSLYAADAGATNSSTRSACVGFTHTATAQGSTAHVVQSGLLQGFSGLTQGAIYYLDPATPGGLTTAMTTTLGQALMSVGVAISSTALLISLGRSQIVANTFPNGAVITGNASVSGSLTTQSLNDLTGIKSNVWMGSYWSTSAPGGLIYLQTALANQNNNAAGSMPRVWTAPFSGYLLGIQIRVYSSVSITPSVIIYKNNLTPLASFNGSATGTNTYGSYTKQFPKSSPITFSPQDNLSVAIGNQSVGSNIQIEADLQIELIT